MNPRLIVAVAVFSGSPSFGWEPAAEPPEFPLGSFVLPEGLEITRWAASPDFYNPTNIDVDHRGRVWVTEGVNYRWVGDRRLEGDRIVVLEDTNGDGEADQSRVFWQDPELVSPLGIAVFDNVVIVSQPPHLLKLTDVNRDLKFDPEDGDTREVLLTGFNGRNHDHSLHSVTAGPDGKWIFSQGNCGAIFEDRAGREFPIGSAYYESGGGEWPVDTRAAAGATSADGFVYVGGFTARMNPDGSQVEIIGHGYRNSYEQTQTSFGDVFQNDNDDPPACRTSHVLEHGNAGYFSANGQRFWNADRRPGQDVPTSHWRQEDPGVMPAGDIYGGGSPTGVAYYENGALGEGFAGTLFSCEAGRNVIFSYQPERRGAGFRLERSDFLTSNPEKVYDGADFTGGVKLATPDAGKETLKYLFRPSDICVGPDGALYVSDWHDPRVGGHATLNESASGIIYRIAPEGFVSSVPSITGGPPMDNALTALKSPAVNTRWLGFQQLKALGAEAYPVVAALADDPDPYLAARAIWLLPYLGEEGLEEIEARLDSADASVRLTAFRALRRSQVIDPLAQARRLSTDPSPAVRAEAAMEMRYRPFEEAREVLVNVALHDDGGDRSYLEMLGLGSGHHRAKLWLALRESMDPGEPEAWPDRFARLTWRLMPAPAIPALAARAASTELSPEQRRLAVDSLAFIDIRRAADALINLVVSDSPVKEEAEWWLNNRSEGAWSSFLEKSELESLEGMEGPAPLVEVIAPEAPENPPFTVEDVLSLEGDAARGKLAAARCVMCHAIGDAGNDFGPALKGFGGRQPAEVIAKALVEPSADIAHGYEGVRITLKDGRKIDGRILVSGDPLVIQSSGGITQRVPADQIGKRENLPHSLMLGADQLGLEARDVADIIEWMKAY